MKDRAKAIFRTLNLAMLMSAFGQEETLGPSEQLLMV